MPPPAGLTSREARRRLEELGPNPVAEDTLVLGRALLAKFWAPVPWLQEGRPPRWRAQEAPLPWRLVVAACGAAAAFAVLLDQAKVPILSVFNVE